MTAAHSHRTGSFPQVSLASHTGGLPVEVSLIAQLGHGAGDRSIAQATALQRGHARFVDALDEPSARLGGVDLALGDRSALYSFAVGRHGHPFHRHAGQRSFTAISGSGGTRLRFSTSSPTQIADDGWAFVHALRQVDIAPDCLFTVRFGGGVWHQFLPADSNARHPALFALSCHVDELGGELPADLQQRVREGGADIPMLTELLPPAVTELLASDAFARVDIPTQTLAFEPPRFRQQALCRLVRGRVGWLRASFASRRVHGYRTGSGAHPVIARGTCAPHSLLRAQLPGFDHEDGFELVAAPSEFAGLSASRLLAYVLEGFLANRPRGVGRLMALRNALVRPFGLRTSPIGCPVSSLLGNDRARLYAGRFPVLEQRVAVDDRHAQVLLGADDKHLQFRSGVAVQLRGDGCAIVSLATRVRTRNRFGRIYMALIDRVHQGYVSPILLRNAVEHAAARVQGLSNATLPAGELHALPVLMA